MSKKSLAKVMFFIWMTAITGLSVVAYSAKSLMVSSNVSRSGMEKHIIGYFVAALLCYFAFRRDHFPFVLISGCLIFFYSFALEITQFFLPYRSFNTTDLFANAIGIVFFVVLWAGYRQLMRLTKKN
jgi:VanZ family protein